MFGHHTRKPLVYQVKCKVCNFCFAFKKKHAANVDVPVHDCCKNHTGSSGQMEPDSCRELIVRLHDRHQCALSMLCCDDDSSMRADCRWSNPDYLANMPPGTKLPLVKKKQGRIRESCKRDQTKESFHHTFLNCPLLLIRITERNS